MNNLKNELIEFVKNNKFSYFKLIYNEKYTHLYNYMMENTKKLRDSKTFSYNITTRIFWILNNITDFPRCPICGNIYGEFKNISFRRGYSDTCSSKKCRYSEMIQKMKKTNIEKYGVESTLEIDKIREKSRETMITKYGVDHPMKSQEIKNRMKNTCLKKYGVDNYSKTDEYINRIRNTKRILYGDPNYVNHTKSELTKLKRYGDKKYNNNAKSKLTCLKKYGVDNYSKTDEFKDKLLKYKINKLMEKINSNSSVELVDGCNNIRATDKVIYRWKCKKCGEIFESTYDSNSDSRYGLIARCPKCYPKNSGKSFKEKEVVEYIKSFYNGVIIENTKNIIPPNELDLYIPEKKIAFEFDGLYWHSSEFIFNSKYHLNKTEYCEKHGIQLIHIFENEWIMNNDIVKSRIRNILGIYDNVVYARKCEIKKIPYELSKTFQIINHIQGYCTSSINLGLYCGNELVSIMTFGKPRFNKKYEWELLRFCNKLGYHVIGGAGKLLKYFERNYNPKSLISYADRRWSKGDLYLKLGFEHVGNTKPDYWYFKLHTNVLYSRIRFQKHKIRKLFEKFDESKTEVQNMSDNGFKRIFDCGNMIFCKIY